MKRECRGSANPHRRKRRNQKKNMLQPMKKGIKQFEVRLEKPPFSEPWWVSKRRLQRSNSNARYTALNESHF